LVIVEKQEGKKNLKGKKKKIHMQRRKLCKKLLGCHWAQIAKYQWKRPNLSLLLGLCIPSYNRESCPHLSMGLSKFDTWSCKLVSLYLQFQLRRNIPLHWCSKNGESTQITISSHHSLFLAHLKLVYLLPNPF